MMEVGDVEEVCDVHPLLWAGNSQSSKNLTFTSNTIMTKCRKDAPVIRFSMLCASSKSGRRMCIQQHCPQKNAHLFTSACIRRYPVPASRWGLMVITRRLGMLSNKYWKSPRDMSVLLGGSPPRSHTTGPCRRADNVHIRVHIFLLYTLPQRRL